MDDAAAESGSDGSDGSDESDGDDRGDGVEANGVTARYRETDAERRLAFERTEGSGNETAVVAQNRAGYAMLTVRRTVAGDELERYYGFNMALDHAAELLGASPHDLPVPERAADMGM